MPALTPSPSVLPSALAAGGNSLSFQGLNQLSAAAKADPRDPRAIKAVAQQFEALLMQQMLHTMDATKLGPDLLGGTGGPVYQSMFEQQVATTISQGQGIGLASFLARELSARYGAHAEKPVSHALPARGVAPVHALPAAPEAAPGAAVQRTGSTQTQPFTRGAAALDTRLHEAPAAPTRSTAPAPAAAAAPAAQSTDSAAHAPATLAERARDFVRQILPSASAAAKALGVSPVAVLAQAALETGWGSHAPGNNLFGIKAGAHWQGQALQAATHEFAAGVREAGQAAFRAYRGVEQSVHDYAQVLSSPRFDAVRGHGSDIRAFAGALQRAGYATDPQYANKLLEVAHGPTMRAALAGLQTAAAASSLALP